MIQVAAAALGEFFQPPKDVANLSVGIARFAVQARGVDRTLAVHPRGATVDGVARFVRRIEILDRVAAPVAQLRRDRSDQLCFQRHGLGRLPLDEHRNRYRPRTEKRFYLAKDFVETSVRLEERFELYDVGPIETAK